VGLTDLVADQLGDARDRTLGLLEPLDDAELRLQVSPLMSPLAWDLAHIAHYEELWLLRELVGAPPTDPRFDDLYDAFKHPRRERAELDILDPDRARAFAADVRARVLERLERVDLDIKSGSDDPLLADAFVYGMVIQHEHQHDETMLATINLMGREYPAPTVGVGERAAAPPTPRGDGFVGVGGGAVVIGSDDPWAYDNERPRHTSVIEPFRIATAPVSNGAFARFANEGGYSDEKLWSERGWAWRHEARLEHPQGWCREGDGAWSRVDFGQRAELANDDPVQHVCWYEADAFARWAGARLPAESEWEAAAAGDALQGVGRVWEWTASDFRPYPGFRSFPYREYSEVFFGDEYKVLRGGSWATHPVAGRKTFRNWDFPIRRQIFCGVRLAADA